jgi:KaiC/GvpD/RAD55 family RecA-like ATPase
VHVARAFFGHEEQLTAFDLLLNRLISGCTGQSMIITGLRGVGKTVLLGQFRTKALRAGWAVVEIEVRKHDDDQFTSEFAARLRTVLFEVSPRER